MKEKKEKKRLAILRVLKDADRPLTSVRIAREMLASGIDISERTVRLYLKSLDEEGLTENFGKRGRLINDHGLTELANSRVIEKVGFLSAKIDQMTYSMNFDLAKKAGTVVINATILTKEQLARCAPIISRVYDKGYAMGRLVALLKPEERVGDILVPKGMVGLGTVCSITLNGVLLQYGIPTKSRFGGLLEIRNQRPERFVEIISYDGTSLDPLEVFMKGGMTDLVGAVETGDGWIGASFREIPGASRSRVEDLAQKLDKIGLGGFLEIGGPGQPLFEIPVGEGRAGAVVIGGLNPVAILEETGVRLNSKALAGLIEFGRLFPYKELKGRIRDLK